MSKAEKLRDLVNDVVAPEVPGLSNALYTLNEGYAWPDEVDSVSQQQCLMCWRLVEHLRASGLDPDLVM